jgi:hypothetical protein
MVCGVFCLCVVGCGGDKVAGGALVLRLCLVMGAKSLARICYRTVSVPRTFCLSVCLSARSLLDYESLDSHRKNQSSKKKM